MWCQNPARNGKRWKEQKQQSKMTVFICMFCFLSGFLPRFYSSRRYLNIITINVDSFFSASKLDDKSIFTLKQDKRQTLITPLPVTVWEHTSCFVLLCSWSHNYTSVGALLCAEVLQCLIGLYKFQSFMVSNKYFVIPRNCPGYSCSDFIKSLPF